MSPMGTDERRPSRSPRSQRSRSADVDRLRKYAERIEERRNTEGGDVARFYANRWLNLPKSPNFYDKSQSDGDSNLEITESHEKLILRKSGSRDDDRSPKTEDNNWSSMQSDSEVTDSTNDIHVSTDGKVMSFRWIPLPRLGDRPQHTQRTFSVELQSARYAANKWITFAKHPSPASSRSSLDRKSSMIRFSSYYDKELKRNRKKQNSVDPPQETPAQKSPTEPEVVVEAEKSPKEPPSFTQKIQDLYKFRFQSDGSKVSSDSSRNYWASKSSSDDDDDSSRNKNTSNRRGSQDLEFNDRFPKRFTHLKSHLFKRFNERLRFSEDMGTGRKASVKYDRKAFSEDYGDGPSSNRRSWPSKLDVNEETESTDTSSQQPVRERKTRRGTSMEYKSSRKLPQTPARRTLSYGAEYRPPTPVPPEEVVPDDLPSKFTVLKEKRRSTRYKVYLT